MNEMPQIFYTVRKKTCRIFIIVIIVIYVFGCLASFASGRYWLPSGGCAGSDVRQAGQADNEFRAQLEIEQRRIDGDKARFVDAANLLADGLRGIERSIDRLSVHVDNALDESGDIRTTAAEIRAAVKVLADERDSLRNLVDHLAGGERDTGIE